MDDNQVMLTKLQVELSIVYDNLSATQDRCTALLNENRTLHQRIAQMERNWVQLLRGDHT